MDAKITITNNFKGYGLGLLINSRFHTVEITEKDFFDFQDSGVPWNPFEF